MEIFRGVDEFKHRFVHPVLTIGNFDGVHLGHRAILEEVISRARSLGVASVLYTFEPHPRRVLQTESGLKLLETFEQKAETLEAIGLDALIAEKFDLEFARMTPETFVSRYIHEGIDPAEVYVGYDFHFGRDREGSMRLLTEQGPRLGFSVTVVPEVFVDGRDVNSTRIRRLLGEGEVAEAQVLLGRPFCVRGVIEEGERRGRELGFPTANLDPETEILPGPGVYFGHLTCLDEGEGRRGRPWPVVTNVGHAPTFRTDRELIAEAHLIGFSGDLYGRRVDLSFEGRIRGEKRFDGVEALRAQIALDVAAARSALGVAPPLD